MEKYSPAYLVVDGNCDILSILKKNFSLPPGGEAGRYLEPSSGTASLTLWDSGKRFGRSCARPCGLPLQPGVRLCRKTLAMRIDGRNQIVTVIVEPLPEAEIGLCVVAFGHGTRSLHIVEDPAQSG